MIYDILIDLSKIDKKKIIVGKTGKKYLALTIADRREPDQYGNDLTIWQKQTKEERDKGAERNYCGQGKTITFNKEETKEEWKEDYRDAEQGDLPF